MNTTYNRLTILWSLDYPAVALLSNSFELVAGDVALDLVNTVSWRGDRERRIERIPTFESLVHWSSRAGLLQDPPARRLMRSAAADAAAAERSTRQVRGLREDLHLVIASHLDGTALQPEALNRLRLLYLQALRNVSPTALPLTWEISLDSPATLVHALALRAMRLLQSDDVNQIGRCADDACQWVFIDRSRNHSRRWCSSTDCGNRDRAARHYARHRTVSS
jgi:predicted RNA-binding Zn ribbon-like protein